MPILLIGSRKANTAITFENWFKPKEFADTFIGVNIRTGVGNSLVQEIANLASGTDLYCMVRQIERSGRALGNYLLHLDGANRSCELERALGMKNWSLRLAKDPTLMVLMQQLQLFARPFRAEDLVLLQKKQLCQPVSLYSKRHQNVLRL